MRLPNCDGHLPNLVVIETTTLNQDIFSFLLKNTLPYIIFPEGAFLCRKFYKPTNGNTTVSEKFNSLIQFNNTYWVASLVKLKFRFGWEHNKHETDAEIKKKIIWLDEKNMWRILKISQNNNNNDNNNSIYFLSSHFVSRMAFNILIHQLIFSKLTNELDPTIHLISTDEDTKSRILHDFPKVIYFSK